MDKDIIDPEARIAIMKRNAEALRFQDTQDRIIKKLAALWSSKQEVEHATIQNEFYYIEYSVKNNYNRHGNRMMMINGRKFQGYNYENMTNIVKRYVCE
tara:strand:- start:347 stop:643 length:297 start_codon:yes stop_codon:yes gene_type:complete